MTSSRLPISIKIVILIIVILSFNIGFSIYWISWANGDAGYKEMDMFDFPLDEGRHEGVNESWWFGSYVTSNTGEKYFICALYVMRCLEENLIQAVAIKDIQTGLLYSVKNNYPANSFSCDSNKLDISIGSTEKWFQISSDPYTYKLTTELSDEFQKVSLDFKLKSNKGPTIESTLGSITEMLNDTAYYDHTNIDVVGNLSIGNKKMRVKGAGYISREWGKTLGWSWQWSAVQLDNNYEICAAKFQGIGGLKDEGWIVNPEGKVKAIQDLEITLKEYNAAGWSDKWLLTSKNENFNLTVELMSDLSKVIGLYEGICSVEGVWDNNLFGGDTSIKGICFTEQTARFLQ